jgi:hypothetical protein
LEEGSSDPAVILPPTLQSSHFPDENFSTTFNLEEFMFILGMVVGGMGADGTRSFLCD